MPLLVSSPMQKLDSPLFEELFESHQDSSAVVTP